MEKKWPQNYSVSVIKVIKAISMTDGADIQVVGSASQRNQLYSADYDMIETVNVDYAKKEKAAVAYAGKLKGVIKKLGALDNTTIGDIKCGVVPDYDILTDAVKVKGKNVIGYNYDAITNKLVDLYENGVLASEEFHDARALAKEKPTVDDYFKMRDEFKYHILRWTPRDILAGKLTYRGKTYNLAEVIATPSLCKVDAVSWIDENRYTDFSCIYVLKNKGRVINGFPLEPTYGLKEDISYYLSEGNYFKALKRIYSLAKFNDDEATMEKLLPLLNGDLGRLYSISSDIDTILYLLMEAPSVSIPRIRKQLDTFRTRLSQIYQYEGFRRKEEAALHNILTLEEKPSGTNRAVFKRNLDGLKHYLASFLNYHARRELTDAKLLPLPKSYRV